MLVLTRKIGERIVIAGVITIEVLQTKGDRVHLGIQVPSVVLPTVTDSAQITDNVTVPSASRRPLE